MNIFRSREDSLEFWLSFFMIVGALLGAAFCNGMDGAMKEEFLGMEKSLVSAAALKDAGISELFLQVAAGRFSALFLAFLCSMTAISPWLFMGGLAYLGFSSAVMVCALTMDSGLLGIFRYLLLLFPQCLFYIPVIYLLAWWMPIKKKALRPAPALLMVLLTLLGAASETLLNPWISVLFQ